MKFQKLLSFGLVQRYFVGVPGYPFRFQVPVEQEKDLKRRDMMFRGSDHDCVLIKDYDAPARSGDAGDFVVYIGLYPGDDEVVLYSELDIDYRQRQIYYVSDQAPRDGVEIHDGVTLKRSTGTDVFPAFRVRLMPMAFKFGVADVKKGDTVRLLGPGDRELKIWTIDSSQSEAFFYTDARPYGAGLLVVEHNGRISAAYFAADDFLTNVPAIIVGLPLPKDGDARNDAFVPPHYELSLNSRSVTWRYIVASRTEGRKTDNLSIQNHSRKLADITFDGKGPAPSGTGVLFQSSTVIPILNRGYSDIELHDGGGSGRPLIPHLPNPSPSQLKYRDGQWFGEMFVYV